LLYKPLSTTLKKVKKRGIAKIKEAGGACGAPAGNLHSYSNTKDRGCLMYLNALFTQGLGRRADFESGHVALLSSVIFIVIRKCWGIMWLRYRIHVTFIWLH
jgi:hypothetical protein